MNTFDIIRALSREKPYAYANIMGGNVAGSMFAYAYQGGTIVVVEAQGLPVANCQQGIHGLHIHVGGSCTGTKEQPFANVGKHYNKTSCPHPYHTGDLPPLFSDNGRAWMAVYTQKFTPHEIVGRAIIIHQNYDDFVTQPSGNSGAMIACGEIREIL